MIEAIDYQKLADEIVDKLAKSAPPDRVVWDIKQCADYLKVSEKHFGDRIAHRHDFPLPLKLGEGERSHRRWLAREVMDWFEKQR